MASLNKDGKVQTIDAAKFSECCLDLLDRLDPDGLLITRNGNPIAKLVPYGRRDAELIGSLRHKVEVTGDILRNGIEWNATQS